MRGSSAWKISLGENDRVTYRMSHLEAEFSIWILEDHVHRPLSINNTIEMKRTQTRAMSKMLVLPWSLAMLLWHSGVMATRTFSQASFVPPASPTSGSKGPLFFAPTLDPATGPIRKDKAESKMKLEARKKAAQAGGVAANSKKVQVKLLKHVAGTGQAGQVVMVSPAFYNNKLRPSKLAEQISDEQVDKENQQKQEKEEEIQTQAASLESKLKPDGNPFVLKISAKAGPSGQLFGGIGPKVIMDELKRQVPDSYWDNPSSQKNNRIKSLLSLETNSDGKIKETKMRGDIKHVGEFMASMSLTSDITVKFPIRVVSQDKLSP